MCKILLISFLIINLTRLYNSYTIEPTKLELLDKKFRLSIANDPNIKWVAFNVNINKEFRSFEAGQLIGVVGMPENQRWSYEFKRKLQDSDIVYCWVAVQHNRLVFRDMIDPISVEALKNGITGNVIGIRNSGTTTSTEAPIESTKKTTNVNNGNRGCELSLTELQSGGGNICRGDLIFEDKFNSFNQQYWTNEVRIPPTDEDAEFVLYNGTLGIAENGILKIDAVLNNINIRRDKIDLGERCTSNVIQHECVHQAVVNAYLPPISTGRINTKNYFNFKYGRVEVLAKLPIGDWLFPIIALEPTKKEYGAHYKSGEMRIAFARGNPNSLTWENNNINGKHLFGGVVLSKEVSLRHKFMADVELSQVNGRVEHFGERFHLYSLTWTPDQLIMAVDGYEYGRIKTAFKNVLDETVWNKGEHNAPLDQMFYITLGLSAGGHGDFPDDSEANGKPWQNSDPKGIPKFYKQKNMWKKTWSQPSLEVDHVRVYAI